MYNDIAISLEGITLRYPVFEKIDVSNTGHSNLGGEIEIINRKTYIKALDNINLSIKKGERVGIIGHNGAGKSSLLRVISGIYTPQEGVVKINGVVSTVFDKMLGMDQELSGKENIYGRGLFLGKSRSEIEKIHSEIIEFTELNEHINMPIKYYSPGMKARLGFAISTAFDADILLLDEWLGVGDSKFQDQAGERMKNFVSNAGTVVLASHNPKLIEKNCDRVLTFSKGKIIAD